MRHVADAALALHRIPKPTIAKVTGVAVGAGCNMALGCDLVVASEEARFSEIFAKRGLSLDFGGSWLLPRLIGLHKAKELAFFADVISAKEAAELGIVNRVVAGRRARPVRGRLGRPAGRRPAVGPVDDQDHAQHLLRGLDGPGPRGRGPLPDGQLRHRRTWPRPWQAFVEKREPHFEGR